MFNAGDPVRIYYGGHVVIYFHKLNPFSPTKTEKTKEVTIQLWIKVVIEQFRH